MMNTTSYQILAELHTLCTLWHAGLWTWGTPWFSSCPPLKLPQISGLIKTYYLCRIWTYMNIYELQFCFLDTFLMWTTGYPGIENWWFGRSRTWPAICESVALFFPPCPYGSMNCFYRENLHESIDFSIKSNGFPSNKSRFPSSIKPIQKNKGISQCVAWFNR